MDIKLVVGLISFCGVVSSGLIQYYLGRRNELKKKEIEVRTQAYLDLINSVSRIASDRKYGKSRTREQLGDINQAKTNVILVGSDDVVNAVHSFFTQYGDLSSDDSCRAFSKIIEAMRVDLLGENKMKENILFESLFGCR
ncbi:MAG: hypothetical protein V6Z89_23290 [Desulfobacter sp.]